MVSFVNFHLSVSFWHEHSFMSCVVVVRRIWMDGWMGEVEISEQEGLFFYIPFACFLNGGILLRLVRGGSLLCGTLIICACQ